MKKQFLSAILALILCLGLAAPVMAAEEDPERGVLYYEGLITPQYDEAKAFSYDVVNSFSEGYAVVGSSATGTDGKGNSIQTIQLGRIDESGTYQPFRTQEMNWEANQTYLVDHSVYAEAYDLNYDHIYYGGWVYVEGLFDTRGSQFKTDGWYVPMRVPTEGLVPAYQIGPQANCMYLDLNGNVALDFREQYTYYDTNGQQLPGYSDQARYEKYISNVYPFNQGLALIW